MPPASRPPIDRRLAGARWFKACLLALLLAISACSGGTEPSTPSTASPSPADTALATRSPVARGPEDACAVRARSGDADLLRIVDKQRGLPATHAPADLVPIDGRWTVPGFAGQSLRTEAASALVAMLSAAEEQGMRLRIRSGFRSYQEQVQTFDFWVALLGEVQARRESAPAGHSEHQLGTAADVVSAEVGWELIIPFADTAGGRWLAEHAPQYGFAFSYPRDGEPITGYIYEPWHVRYIGTDCAAAWRASGLVLVRFLERLASTR